MFCDHFVAFKTAADYVYISESIENWQDMGKIFKTKMIGWTPWKVSWNSRNKNVCTKELNRSGLLSDHSSKIDPKIESH